MGEYPALPEGFRRVVTEHVAVRPSLLSEAQLWWAQMFEGWKRDPAE